MSDKDSEAKERKSKRKTRRNFNIFRGACAIVTASMLGHAYYLFSDRPDYIREETRIRLERMEERYGVPRDTIEDYLLIKFPLALSSSVLDSVCSYQNCSLEDGITLYLKGVSPNDANPYFKLNDLPGIHLDWEDVIYFIAEEMSPNDLRERMKKPEFKQPNINIRLLTR